MKSFHVLASLGIDLTLFNLCNSLSLSSTTSISPTIQFIRSSIHTKDLTQSYPETLLNKLFSSVPRREKAIDNISLSFGHFDSFNQDNVEKDLLVNTETCGSGLSLLVGRSASGKSTLLRILACMEEPISGHISLNGYSYRTDKIKSGIKEEAILPKPIIIDSKPDCFDSKSSIYQCILNSIPDISIDIPTQQQQVNKEKIVNSLKNSVISEYSQILGFTVDQLHSYTPSDLTPSQQYLFGLTCSSIESSFGGPATNIKLNQDNVVEIPRPILLLDELLDRETSGVANKVGNGLFNLTKEGGIVIAATHRPQFLTGVAERVVTLSSGKVLKVEYLDTANKIS